MIRYTRRWNPDSRACHELRKEDGKRRRQVQEEREGKRGRGGRGSKTIFEQQTPSQPKKGNSWTKELSPTRPCGASLVTECTDTWILYCIQGRHKPAQPLPYSRESIILSFAEARRAPYNTRSTVPELSAHPTHLSVTEPLNEGVQSPDGAPGGGGIVDWHPRLRGCDN